MSHCVAKTTKKHQQRLEKNGEMKNGKGLKAERRNHLLYYYNFFFDLPRAS